MAVKIPPVVDDCDENGGPGPEPGNSCGNGGPCLPVGQDVKTVLNQVLCLVDGIVHNLA